MNSGLGWDDFVLLALCIVFTLWIGRHVFKLLGIFWKGITTSFGKKAERKQIET